MRKILQLFALQTIMGITLLTAGCSSESTKDGVLIHITHGTDHPHQVLMALNMASTMAEQHDVLVYFDLKAIEVVLKNSDNLIYAHFPTSKHQISALPARGVTLMASPESIKAAGKKRSDLADGIQVADKNKLLTFTKGRILTLDY